MKKIKITLTILLIVLITSHAYSQYDDVILFLGDVTLSTQAEVDAFNYTYVTGTLTISGNDITNLDALSALTEVGALIITQNGSLTNANGLSALSQVGGVYILNNPVLTNLDGFSSLTSMFGPITIRDNASLETINGFSGLSSITFGLRISNNQQLKSFIGFKQLGLIDGYDGDSQLLIDNNASLTNIEGLSSLQEISGKPVNIRVTNNAALLNIDGLRSVSTLGTYGCSIDILNNPVLKNIDGLASLTVFQDGAGLSGITIQNNAELENIDGLANLRGPYGIYLGSHIIIMNNQGLSRCSGLYPLLVSIGWDVVTTHIEDGSFEVTENGAGCTMEDIINSGPQVIEAFSVINKHTGDQVYQPINNEVTLDLANPDFSNWTIKAHTFPSLVGSVQFRLLDKSKQKDNTAPYVFVPHSLDKPGTYTLSGVPFSDSHGKGEQGIEGTLTITVINSGANNLIASNQEQSEELSIYPVPVEDELHLKMNDNAGSDALLTIRSIQGNLVYTGQVSPISSINTLNFQPGVYVLQIFGNNGFHKVVRFIKK